MIHLENRVEVNFSRLSDEELKTLLTAGSGKAGYMPYQVAQMMSIWNQGASQGQPEAQKRNDEDFILEIPREQYLLMAALLQWEIPEVEEMPQESDHQDSFFDDSIQEFGPEEVYPFSQVE